MHCTCIEIIVVSKLWSVA